MPTAIRKDIDNLNAELTVTIPREDIAPEIKSELKKIQQKATIKGFRKGKTPINFVKKMYGDSILVDVVNKTIEAELSKHIKEAELNLLGQPIPTENQELADLSINGKEDLVFKFDLGIAPKIDVQGVGSDTVMQKYAVEVPDAMIDEDLEAGRKRVGERKEVEDNIQEGDSITINADEMDGDALKLDGWASTFTVLYNDIGDEKLKEALATKKVGDTFEFNIRTIESGEQSDEHIRKYLLNVTEEDVDVEIGDNFKGTIQTVHRVMPAEMNQDFFDKYFGKDEVKSEEEARDFIRKDIASHYDRQATSLMYRDIQDMLFEKNDIELPNEFLKRWLMISSEDNTAEIIEKGYDGFAKNLKFTLMRSELAKKYDVEVKYEDIAAKMKQNVMSMYGQYIQDASMLDMFVKRMMEDNQQVEKVAEELLSERVFAKIAEDITVEEKTVTKEEFEKIIEEARAAMQAAQAEANAEETATETVAEAEVVEEE